LGENGPAREQEPGARPRAPYQVGNNQALVCAGLHLFEHDPQRCRQRHGHVGAQAQHAARGRAAAGPSRGRERTPHQTRGTRRRKRAHRREPRGRHRHQGQASTARPRSHRLLECLGHVIRGKTKKCLGPGGPQKPHSLIWAAQREAGEVGGRQTDGRGTGRGGSLSVRR